MSARAHGKAGYDRRLRVGLGGQTWDIDDSPAPPPENTPFATPSTVPRLFVESPP